MASEFGAGLSRSDIEYLLQQDPEVLSVERINGAAALWSIAYSFQGQQPVHILVDNGINEIYVQVLVQIDADHIVEALSVVEPFGVVGLFIMNDPSGRGAGKLFMRSGFFVEHSTMHALTNSYRAVAFAYMRYQQSVSA